MLPLIQVHPKDRRVSILFKFLMFFPVFALFSFARSDTEPSISHLLENQAAFPEQTDKEEEQISFQTQYIQTSAVLLKILDKITARVFEVRGNVGGKINFGNLEILPLACYKTPVDEKPESAAHLKMIDRSKGTDTVIFSGWMFASSPSLSSLEHPIYDVWVKECIGLERNPS